MIAVSTHGNSDILHSNVTSNKQLLGVGWATKYLEYHNIKPIMVVILNISYRGVRCIIIIFITGNPSHQACMQPASTHAYTTIITPYDNKFC